VDDCRPDGNGRKDLWNERSDDGNASSVASGVPGAEGPAVMDQTKCMDQRGGEPEGLSWVTSRYARKASVILVTDEPASEPVLRLPSTQLSISDRAERRRSRSVSS